MGVSKKTEASFKRAGKKVTAALKNIKGVMPWGLRGIGEEIMTDVKASRPGHGVPVDKGALRASGRVTQPEPDTIELSFGDSSVVYALIQHEEMGFHHEVGEPRYLVRGLERWKPDGSQAMRALAKMSQEGIKKARKA